MEAIHTILLQHYNPKTILEDFEAPDEQDEPATNAAVFCVRVQLHRGEALLACDKTGFSDPFCNLNVGEQKQKSTTIQQTLNPQWHEDFYFTYHESEPLLKIEVMDWDRLSANDYMGGGEIPINNLELNKPVDVALELKNLKGKKMPLELGTIYLTLTKMKQSTAKELPKKQALAKFSRLVSVDLISACDLPPMDPNGLADPYVKITVGKHTYRSKVKYKTLSPVWKQRFDIAVVDDSRRLVLSVFDRDTAKDELIGEYSLDIDTLPTDRTQSYKVALTGAENLGTLHFRVTVSRLYQQEHTANFSAEEMQQYCGVLHVKVHQARNLDAKDVHVFSQNSSDPFVLLELGQTRVRTPTILKNVNPVWNRTFHMGVRDIFDVLHVSVFDEDSNGKFDFIGRIAVPLLDMHNNVAEWFVLKDKNLEARCGGDILLEFNLDYQPVKAYARVISRRIENDMDSDEKFKFKTLVRNVDRVKSNIFSIIRFVSFLFSLFNWEHGFVTSFVAMMFWIWACLFLKVYMVPALLLAFLSITYLGRERQTITLTETGEFVTNDDDDEEEEESQESASKPRRNFKQRLDSIYQICQTIQTTCGTIANTIERVKNLARWQVPLITALVCVAMAAATVLLYFVPLNYVLLIWGVRKFIRKGLQKYRPFGMFGLPKGHRPVNEVLELVSRVPTDVEITQYKRLPQISAKATRKSAIV